MEHKFKVGDRVVGCTDRAVVFGEQIVDWLSSDSAAFKIEGDRRYFSSNNYKVVGNTRGTQDRKRGSIYRFKTKAIFPSEIELSRENPVAVVSIDEDRKASYVYIHSSLTHKALVTSTSLAIGILRKELPDRDLYHCSKKQVKELVQRCKDLYQAPWPNDEVHVTVLTVNMQG